MHVKQGWGEAQVSGVIHNVNVKRLHVANFNDSRTAGSVALRCATRTEGKVGWGIDAGVKINLPSFGAGDEHILTGSYTQNAVWYSGLPDAMNGENGRSTAMASR